MGDAIETGRRLRSSRWSKATMFTFSFHPHRRLSSLELRPSMVSVASPLNNITLVHYTVILQINTQAYFRFHYTALFQITTQSYTHKEMRPQNFPICYEGAPKCQMQVKYCRIRHILNKVFDTLFIRNEYITPK